MIPARIGESKKKHYCLPHGFFNGFWQNYFCWVYDETGKIFLRFDTKTKCKFKKGEKVKVKIIIPKIYIYEVIKNYDYENRMV